MFKSVVPILHHLIFYREEIEEQQREYLANLDAYEQSHLGNFRRIYPNNNESDYERFMHSSASIFQETAAYKARLVNRDTEFFHRSTIDWFLPFSAHTQRRMCTPAAGGNKPQEAG